MNTKPLVYGLSAVAVVLGLLFLISTISAPSLDPVIFARDLVTSVLAIALGVLAPILIRRFTRE
jgi:Mg/Co/Ni transporter MgtE